MLEFQPTSDAEVPLVIEENDDCHRLECHRQKSLLFHVGILFMFCFCKVVKLFKLILLNLFKCRDLREKMQPFGRFQRPSEYEQMFHSLQSK